MSSAFILLSPELALTIASGVALLCGVIRPLRKLCAPVALLGLAASAVGLWWAHTSTPAYGTFFAGMLAWDPVARFFKALSIAILGFIILLAHGDRGVGEDETGEYYCLLLLVGVGMMLLASAHHFATVILAMELMSLCGYLLVAFQRHDPRSSEAALKYFLFGAMTSALMLYGLSLLYAITQTLDLGQLAPALALAPAPALPLVLLAGTFLLLGFGFKISMVPVHMWTPDAYEGAPIPVAALLSVGPKAAGFAILMRVFGVNLGATGNAWLPILAGLTVITMTLGNLVALTQTNIKRLLAYSTIAQVGYLLLGVVAASRIGEASVWLYLIVYVCMNCGAFAVVSAVTNATGNESLEAYRGLAQRTPWLALLMAICLLSLAGIPPLAGFLGKFYLFGAALFAHHPWLAIAGAVNSVIALFYYVKIIRYMYLDAPVDRTAVAVPWSLATAAVIAVVATVAIGLYPAPLLGLIGQSLLLL